MTNAEIFDQIMSGRGGCLKRYALPEISIQAYSQISEQAEALIESAKKFLPNLPPIHFDFVKNGNVNAWAFKAEGMYFIGLTSGTVYLLTLILTRMLADARLFPGVGDEKKEADDLPPIRDFTPHSEKIFQAGVPFTLPRSDARSQYALSIRDHALLFLVGHEIEHIAGGHVDYMEAKMGSALIDEMGWNYAEPSRLIERQCLEWKADMRSVWSRVASLKLTHEAPDLQTPPWSETRESPGHLIFNCTFAINTLFRLFGDIRFNSTDLSNSPYPPLPLRRTMAATATMHAVVESWDANLRDKAQQAIRMGVNYTEETISTIFGQEPSIKGLLDAVSPLGRDHIKRLANYWIEELQDRLAPYAYE